MDALRGVFVITLPVSGRFARLAITIAIRLTGRADIVSGSYIVVSGFDHKTGFGNAGFCQRDRRPTGRTDWC